MRLIPSFAFSFCLTLGMVGCSLPAPAPDAMVLHDDDSRGKRAGSTTKEAPVLQETDEGADSAATQKGGCASGPLTVLSHETFEPMSAEVVLLGGARASAPPVQQWIQLTDGTEAAVGALFWKGSYRFSRFTMSAQIFAPATLGSDGMTFAWVPESAPQLGTGGAGFGYAGLGGYAVAIDWGHHQGQPGGPSVAILDGMGARLASTPITDVRDGQPHALVVVLDVGGRVTVKIDATTYVQAFPIPGHTPVIGHFGFTAASSASAGQAHYVSDVSVVLPDGACVQ